MEMLEGLGLVAGGGAASFAGAFAAIKVHIGYLVRDSKSQEEKIEAIRQQMIITDRKADMAHKRLDYLGSSNS